MKIKAYFFVLLVFSVIPPARAEAIGEWIAKGCPSPDREWQAKDYRVFNELLARGTLPLPRFDSESGRSILHRLVATQNLSFHRNRTLPPEARIPDLLSLMESARGIMMLYVRAANAGENVERESADLIVFLLAVASTAIELTQEFVPTIPKDAKYATRMAGLAKMASGFTTLLDGAFTSISERTFYSDESIGKMVRGIRAHYSQFRSILPKTAQMEFRLKVESMFAKEKNLVVRRELASLRDAMIPEPQ